MGLGTNYPGNPNAVQSPSPVPGPGVVPVVYLPSDLDGNTVANFWQSEKVPADFIAYLQKTALWRPPGTLSSTTPGFTAVTHTGAGTGTVTPKAPLNALVNNVTNGPQSVMINIIVGGAVGVATFQWSNDGGVTYGTTQTTAASYTDGTSGITIAFGGTTFNANDTYAFRPTDTPLAQFQDSVGITRGIFDALGHHMGRVTEFREDWFNFFTAPAASGTTNPLVGNQKWQAVNTNGAIAFNSIGANQVATGLKISCGASQSCYLLSSNDVHPGLSSSNTWLCHEWDFEVASNAIAASHGKVYLGFNQGTSPGTLYFWLRSDASVNANWQLECANGGTATTLDTGIQALGTSDPFYPNHRIRMQMLCSTGPFGIHICRAFIDEKLIGNLTTNIPSGGMKVIAGVAGDATNGAQLYFGSVLGKWARWSTSIGL